MPATGKEAVSLKQAKAMYKQITGYLTNQTDIKIRGAVAAEAEAREKADQLLESEVDGKLDAADLVAGENVTITPDPESGHVTIAASGGEAPVAYTAGEGLALSGHEFSIADGGVTADKMAAGVIPDTSGFLTTAAAAETYQPKGNYLTSVPAEYLTQTEGDAAYQPKGDYAAANHTHTASQVTGLTASRALVSDASGHPAASAVTSTELGYLDGVTSGIQAQLNGKAAFSHTHTVSQITDFPEIPEITLATDAEAKGFLGY